MNSDCNTACGQLDNSIAENLFAEVIVHHNIFRRYYNQKGKEVNSSKYFTNDSYFCQIDQIYLYGRNNLWNPFNDRCFVAPIINKDDLEIKKEKNHIGILIYGNRS